MDSTLPDSIFLITSSNPNNRRFGTGFVIHKDNNETYILTCAHVIDDVEGSKQSPVKADGHVARVVALDDDRFPDLAVLKVEGLLDKPILRLSISGDSGSGFVTAGWFKWTGKQHQFKILQGKLGKYVALTLKGAERINAWDLKITDEDDNLEPGYSGSPMVDETTGCVMGVISDRLKDEKRGLAISIEALTRIWPEMLPNLIIREASAKKHKFSTGPGAIQARKIPPILPYMVNRSDQVFRLEQAIKSLNVAPSRPVVCLIHGDDRQSHDTFFERLKISTLPRLLNLSEQISIKDYSLIWPTKVNIDELHQWFEEHLRAKIVGSGQASIAEINQRLFQLRSPVIIYSPLSIYNWRKDELKSITSFLTFWQKWPNLAPNQRLFIFLSIKYVNQTPGVLSRFIQKFSKRAMAESLEEIAFSEFDGILGVRLPKLDAVTREEVENWIYEKVKNMLDDTMIVNFFQSEIRQIFEEWHEQTGAIAIPMEELAPRLQKMLFKYLENEGGAA